MKFYLKSFAFILFPVLFFSCKKDKAKDPPVANAGNSQTIQLPASSFTLTGSGTTQNGSISGYIWTLVSGPNVPVIASPSSSSTSVTGFIKGDYIFQLLVRDDAGLTGTDTTTVTVNPSPIQTLTLQPSNNNNELLFAILGSTPQSAPQPPELTAAAWTSSAMPYNFRAAFKFDLSQIPATATIISAKLTLYSNPTPLNGDLVHANSGTDNSMFISRITGDWTPAGTNWLNQPPVSTADQISIPHTAQSLVDLVDIDVKNMVAAMVSTNNYGFMIQLQNEVAYTIRDFCSSWYADATKHPKLVITYQP
ncbi:MAG: DNRLRE domain-containing protein [Chitinophagales bacterium]